MKIRRLGFLVGVVGLVGCGPERLIPGSDGDETGDGDEIGHETGDGDGDGDGDETGDGDGDEPSAPTCDCVDLEQICSADAASAQHDCELPSPCGVVNGDSEAAECVLELLIAGEPARFAYSIEGEGCGLGYELWEGWFYILGPGEGVDNECHTNVCDFSMIVTPEARHYAITEPAYYADCLGKSASVMTGCIFNGLEIGEPVTECGG